MTLLFENENRRFSNYVKMLHCNVSLKKSGGSTLCTPVHGQSKFVMWSFFSIIKTFFFCNGDANTLYINPKTLTRVCGRMNQMAWWMSDGCTAHHGTVHGTAQHTRLTRAPAAGSASPAPSSASASAARTRTRRRPIGRTSPAARGPAVYDRHTSSCET